MNPRYRQIYHVYALPWLLWGIGTFFILYQFSMQLSFGVLALPLMHEFHLSPVTMGNLAASYYYVYILLQTPAGWLVDLYGVRQLFILGSLTCTLGAWIIATATTIMTLFLGRILMGAGAAFAFVGTLALIRTWHPRERFSLLTGMIEALALLTSMFTDLYFATLLQSIAWRQIIWGIIVWSASIFLLSFIFIPDKPTTTEPSAFFWIHVRFLVRKINLWLNAAYAGFMGCLINIFGGLWLIPFMQLAHSVNAIEASQAASALFIGTAIGCPTLGMIDHYLQRRRLILIFSSFFTTLILTKIILYPAMNFQYTLGWCFLLGCCCGSYMLPYAIACDLVPDRLGNLVVGLTNAIAVLLSPLLHPLIGSALSISMLHHHNSVPSVQDYQAALLILVVGTFISLCIALRLPLQPQTRADDDEASEALSFEANRASNAVQEAIRCSGLLG